VREEVRKRARRQNVVLGRGQHAEERPDAPLWAAPGVDKIDELIEDTDKALKGLLTLPSRLPPTGPDPKALKREARAGGGLVTRHACL
jgi:hypothetical protein